MMCNGSNFPNKFYMFYRTIHTHYQEEKDCQYIRFILYTNLYILSGNLMNK